MKKILMILMCILFVGCSKDEGMSIDEYIMLGVHDTYYNIITEYKLSDLNDSKDNRANAIRLNERYEKLKEVYEEFGEIGDVQLSNDVMNLYKLDVSRVYFATMESLYLSQISLIISNPDLYREEILDGKLDQINEKLDDASEKYDNALIALEEFWDEYESRSN